MNGLSLRFNVEIIRESSIFALFRPVLALSALSLVLLASECPPVAAQVASMQQAKKPTTSLDVFDATIQRQFSAFLSTYGVTHEELQALAFVDLVPDESRQTLWQSFRALRRFAKREAQLSHTIAESWQASQITGQLARLSGRLQQIELVPLPNDLQESFGTRHCYRCEILLSGGDGRSVLFALHVPARLLASPDDLQRASGQPVTCWGLVAATNELIGQESDSEIDETAADVVTSTRVTMIADRLLWIPDAVDAALGVEPYHLWLAEQGIDLDALSAMSDGTELSAADHASFYQLLAAARDWDQHVDHDASVDAVDVGKMLNSPEALRGRLFRVRGVARRIRPIYTEPNVAVEFGVQRYFELEIMTEVDPSIRIDAGDSSRLFARYPVVICAASLPSSMTTGDNVHEPIEFTGVFLKNWAYPSAWLTQSDARFFQSSPLLIGRQPIALSRHRRNSGPGSLFRWIALVIVLGIVGFGWQVARWNRQLVQQRRATRANAEPPKWETLDE